MNKLAMRVEAKLREAMGASPDEAYAHVLAGRKKLEIAREVVKTGVPKDGMTVEQARDLLKRTAPK